MRILILGYPCSGKTTFSEYLADALGGINVVHTDKYIPIGYNGACDALLSDLNRNTPSVIVEGYNGGSSKIDTALSIVCDAIDAERKILLFSQFTSVLDNIKKTLKEHNFDYIFY